MMNAIAFMPVNSGLVSVDNGTPVRFTVNNLSNENLTMYWVDHAGVLQAYSQISQNSTIGQSTITSHIWEIKSADGKIAFEFTPTVAGQITIDVDHQLTFTDFSEKVISTPNGLWSSYQGYGLIDAAKSLGINVTTTLSVNGQNNNLALDSMNAPSAWAAGYTGKGIKVAVIDIGIAANSEVDSKIVDQYDFYQNDADARPNDGIYKDHALGVASIIAASHNVHGGRDTMGVAPDALLINVRVGSSVTGSSSQAMADGIRFAVDHGAKVICMPLESSGTQIDTSLVSAVDYAYQHNVVTVIIGGNYSNYGATGPAMIAQLKGEAIDVGNYNVATGTPFDSSNMAGDTPFPWVMASSTGYVPNSTGSYSYWGDGGTSFAGPYVAGLAALLFQQSPNATASEIINKITSGASLGGSAATTNLPVPTLIKGTTAIDVSVFTHTAGDYSINIGVNSTTVTELGNGAQTILTNVERLQFSDKSIALDVSGNSGEIYRLYQAAFNRAPDKAGLGFWMNAMDHGATLSQVANGFTHSDEFIKMYGVHPDNGNLVIGMYNNVLHRTPEKAGADFWINALNHGTTTEQLLTSFSDSAENIANIAKIIGQGFEYTPTHA